MKLSKQTLGHVPATIKKPAYDLDDVTVGVLHFGPSFFFRGHLAVYFDDLLEAGHMNWGICAVSLHSNDIKRLEEQDYLYTVVEEGRNGKNCRVVGSLRESMWARDNPKAVIERMMDPNIKLVTMTITQKGYYYHPDKILDLEDEAIKTSLQNMDAPTTVVGFIVAALDERRKKGIPPFSVMSCDNLENNAEILRDTVLVYAREHSKELQEWIAENVSFQGTMVDRIVPSRDSTSIKREHFPREFHINDVCPIFTEQFRQLVISGQSKEAELPPLDKVGALLVDEVAAYELMKIRSLNGAHMALGMLGRLNGYTHVDEAMSNRSVKGFVKGFMEEVGKTLPEVKGVDLDTYRSQLIERLENPHMKDELVRLARNGVDKLSSRFLSPLRDAYAQGGPIENRHHLLLSVALWIEYLRRAGRDSGFDIKDDKAKDLGLLHVAAELDSDPTPILLHADSSHIWEGMQHNRLFINELKEIYGRLDHHMHDRIRQQLDMEEGGVEGRSVFQPN